MTDDIVTQLREWHTAWNWYLPDQAAEEIERLRQLASAMYEETKKCGSKHDVKATNDWENYEQEVRCGLSVDPDKYVSPTEAADEIERLREQVAEYKNLYLLRSRLGDAVGGV